MNRSLKKKTDACGFSLMEIMVSLAILMMLFIGLYSLIQLSTRLVMDNSMQVEAIEIANQKMEIIRNLPYSDVGVLAGIPNGIIAPVEIIYREGTYTVNTYVQFYDDPFDGQIGSTTPDTIPNDYKIATVRVHWQSRSGPRQISVFSKIIPRTYETNEGYGVLRIYVGNTSAQPVSNANVRIINNALVPAVDATNQTDASGLLYLPVLPSAQSYEVYVTKTDEEPAVYYGDDQTYDPATSKSPFHLTAVSGALTGESFVIDKMSKIKIRTVSSSLPDNRRLNREEPAQTNRNGSLGRDASDNFYAVWESVTATSSRVYIQKYDASLTSSWADDKRPYAGVLQSNPDIAVSAAGVSYVAWQDDSRSLKLLTHSGRGSRLAGNQAPGNKSGFGFRLAEKRPLSFDFDWRLLPDAPWRQQGAVSTPYAILYKTAVSALSDKWQDYSFWIMPAKAAAGSVSFVGVSAGATTAATNNISLSVPAGVAPGDFLLAFIHHDDESDGPMLPPVGQGWNTLDNTLDPGGWSSDSRGGLWWKIVGAADPAVYTFTLSSNTEQKAGHIRAYRGVDTANPFDGGLAADDTDRFNELHPAPSLAVSADDSMLVCGWGTDSATLANSGPAFPSGMGNTRTNSATDIGIASADQEVDAADSPTGTRVFDANTSVSNATMAWSVVLKPAVLPDDVLVSAIGSQTAALVIPDADNYLGGAFALSDLTGSHNITGIKISENGSVDAAADLLNVRLYYDLDNSAPYDCASESYGGAEPQFGFASNFDFSNGSATFAGSVNISTVNTMCVYTVFDISAGASGNETVEIYLNNPPMDIEVSGNVIPDTQIILPGTTELEMPARLKQARYRWHNDDGSEAAATWKTSQNQPAILDSETVRLRLEIANIGTLDSSSVQYRLEYGKKITECASIIVWTPVPADLSGHWQIVDSVYFADGDVSANISGLDDEGTVFVSGYQKDSGNQTAGIVLPEGGFTEIEFALALTANAEDGGYCFRLTDAGSSASYDYAEYAEAVAAGDGNIYVSALDSAGDSLWALPVRANTDAAGEEQEKPAIALTENFGDATTTVCWEDVRNGNQDIYCQIIDHDGNKGILGDLQLSASSTDEYDPDVAININDYAFVVWTENDGGSESVYLQRIDMSDYSLWAEPEKIAGGLIEASLPSIAADPNGNIFLSYTEEISGIKKSSLAKIDSGGNIAWRKQVNDGGADYEQSGSVVAVGAVDIYAAWTDTRNGNNDIYGQKFDQSGTPQWVGDTRVSITAIPSDQSGARIVFGSGGSPYAAWNDNRDGNYSIYGAEFFESGVMAPRANVPIRVSGTKTISENPMVREFLFDMYTNSSGEADLDVEWDAGYAIELVSASTSLNIILEDPVSPLSILANEEKFWYIYVE